MNLICNCGQWLAANKIKDTDSRIDELLFLFKCTRCNRKYQVLYVEQPDDFKEDVE